MDSGTLRNSAVCNEPADKEERAAFRKSSSKENICASASTLDALQASHGNNTLCCLHACSRPRIERESDSVALIGLRDICYAVVHSSEQFLLK